MPAPAAFDSLLVANRGEIALRVFRTARALGLRTVAVHSEADAGAPHVRLADDAVCLGSGPAAASYLNAAAILAAARATGAQAVHPGYGFLSENADFAQAVIEAGLVWVGPPPAAIAAMGDKAAARQRMAAAGVPVVPGYDGTDQSDARLAAEAARIGWPVMVKAAAGGGGRGLRRVAGPEALAEALARARAEAEGAFGDGRLILERALDGARHVEVQVAADAHGACLHLGERDCSVQRRHQKLIEEAPAPGLTPMLREALGAAAVAAARAVGYVGLGTVEFLLAPDGAFHFLEMNTRLQVEHPVTEAVTGLDLVALQLAVARGAPLPLTQDELRLSGHAIEARLYAEDPAQDYRPVAGRLALWRAPEGAGLRTDAGIETGSEVPPFYDALLAKIVAHGPDRATARQRLAAALEDTAALGLPTNRALLAAILAHPEFVAGGADTGLMARAFPAGLPAAAPGPEDWALAAAVWLTAEQRAAAASAGVGAHLWGFASDGAARSFLDLACNGAVMRLEARPLGALGWQVTADGTTSRILWHDWAEGRARGTVGGRGVALSWVREGERLHLAQARSDLTFARHRPWQAAAAAAAADRVVAPMPGLVAALPVAAGARVARGQVVAVLEAMKMQHPLAAPRDGLVAAVPVAPGAQVAAGALLVELAPETAR